MLHALARRWIAPVAVIVAAVAASGALAQGQAFAPPLSTESLERLLGRYVKPPPESMAAIEAAHDRYLDEYRRLQDAELEAFARERPPMFTGADMAGWMRRYVALRGRIIALDSTLIESIRQAVPEANRNGVDRVRWNRELDVLRSGMLAEMGMAFGGRRGSLSDIVYSLGLSEEDLARADPILREHEQRILTATRRGAEESERLFTDLGERMQKEGIWGPALEQAQQDPERMMELQRRIAGIISETFRGMLAISHANREIDRRGYLELRERLSWDGQMALAPAWLAHGVPQLSHQWPRGFVDLVQRAKRAVGPESQTGRAIDAIGRETLQRTISALDASERLEERLMAEMIAQQFEVMGGMDEEGMEARAEAMQQQEALRRADQESRQRIIQSGVEAIRAHLPPELQERLKLPDGVNMQIDWNGPLPALEGTDELPMATVDAEGGPAAQAADRLGGDVVLEGLVHQLAPYNTFQLMRFMSTNDLPEDQRSILEALHSDYLAQWQTEMGPRRAAYDEARMRIYTVEDPSSPRFDSAQADRAAAILNEFVAAAERLDEEFFTAVAATLGPAHEAAVRAERLGRITAGLGRVSYRDWMWWGISEQAIDVVAVVREVDLPEADRAVLQEILLANAEAIVAASKECFRASTQTQLSMEKLQSQMWRPDLSPEERQKAAIEWQRRANEIMAPANAAVARRRAAVGAVLTAAQERLPEESFARFQRAWSRASFPAIYADGNAHFETIRRIERLPDLTPQQAEQLAAILEEYQRSYELACDAMLAAVMVPLPQMGDGFNEEYWMARQERERAVERMRFERDETSARAASRLRQLLTPEQLAQFRTLTDPARTSQGPARAW